MATPLSKEQLEQSMEQFVTTCRAAGLKITHQRTETYRNLMLQPDHPTVETLHKRLLNSLPSISLDTVYRTLTTLVECGLVARIQTAESQARFEAVTTTHHHLICSRCKQVLDFQWPAIESCALPQTATEWGSVHSKTVVMYGNCKSCSPS